MGLPRPRLVAIAPLKDEARALAVRNRDHVGDHPDHSEHQQPDHDPSHPGSMPRTAPAPPGELEELVVAAEDG